ncbi:MAG TPA: peptide chain release factor N(5)-glutamine methyltransferase [Lentisphaeria bacterium]|nr:MAG: protein-(glutamine-N5) methyltransferase, release factor-specific [Lentisphaerae bacterium GWF2_38_69]HBM17555.1 peptide chain release factor N(5)-glutamine methyltransferase [Lentisphaeria bacterium]
MAASAKDFLRNITDPTIKFEIETLISNFLFIDRIDIYLNPNLLLTTTQEESLRNLISRRLNGEPLQYILGYAHFRELKLEVGSGVLIPRPETEKIVDMAAEFIFPNTKILDIGTGSGAIALSVGKEFQHSRVLGVDISEKALTYAERNKKLNGIPNVEFRINDLCAGLGENSFDIILANLPYIPYSNYQNLERDVKDFEPELALTPGKSGLELIEKLILQSISVLKPNGVITLEIDKNQSGTVCELFANTNAFHKAKTFKDYNALDRFVLAQKLETK